MKEKVILAYSGGLDTTAIIPWLKENYDYEVICCCIDVGQKDELDGLEERAKNVAQQNFISKMLLKNMLMIISSQLFKLMLYLNTNIYLELQQLDL